MIPWYNDHNGEDGDAKHYTWGSNPPTGTYQELRIDYANEFIGQVQYDECGLPGHKHICFLYLQVFNKKTRWGKKLICGDENHGGTLILYCRLKSTVLLHLEALLTPDRPYAGCHSLHWRLWWSW